MRPRRGGSASESVVDFPSRLPRNGCSREPEEAGGRGRSPGPGAAWRAELQVSRRGPAPVPASSGFGAAQLAGPGFASDLPAALPL